MVEIALSLAVIGFALVAIIGVLPTGLDVQKNNRQETIVNHDAGVWLDAIRNGARGMDDLTNYVIGITNFWTLYDTNVPLNTPWIYFRDGTDGYDPNGSSVTSLALTASGLPVFPLTNGLRIVGLLTRPKAEYAPNGPTYLYQSNFIVAYVRALSGPASEKFPQADATVRDLAFSYRLISDNVVLPAYDTNSPAGRMLRDNLHEIRLTFRWPLLPNWTSGNGRQTYRALVGGHLLPTTDPTDQYPIKHPVWFYEPAIYQAAP